MSLNNFKYFNDLNIQLFKSRSISANHSFNQEKEGVVEADDIGNSNVKLIVVDAEGPNYINDPVVKSFALVVSVGGDGVLQIGEHD